MDIIICRLNYPNDPTEYYINVSDFIQHNPKIKT